MTAATVGTTEQVEGDGCVYPAATQTLPGQLAGGGPAAGRPTSRTPGDRAGGLPERRPEPRNPFVYFHSLLDSGECAERDVGLDQLAPDLKKARPKRRPSPTSSPTPATTAPKSPCAPGQPAGLAGAESFLQTVVPEIEASAAYKVGGLIAITFAQAPQAGPERRPSSCCATPEYPNLTVPPRRRPPTAAARSNRRGGGGRVGMLLLSPYVLPGSVDETGYFNHFSFLRSIEELFGLTPLGYAAEPAVVAFDETVYNNAES